MIKLIVGTFGPALFVVSAATMVYGQNPSLTSPLKVQIKSEQTSVKNTRQIAVHTTITNTSNDTQELQVWSCSYPDHWASDNPFVHVDQVQCNKNGLMDVRLKAGQAYERELFLRVLVNDAQRQLKSVTFRLAFSPWTPNQDESVVFWSNPVTIQVKNKTRSLRGRVKLDH